MIAILQDMTPLLRYALLCVTPLLRTLLRTKQGMAAAYATSDYTLQAVADAFDVHYSTVSRAINGR